LTNDCLTEKTNPETFAVEIEGGLNRVKNSPDERGRTSDRSLEPNSDN
jgi:hypothetical protein